MKRTILEGFVPAVRGGRRRTVAEMDAAGALGADHAGPEGAFRSAPPTEKGTGRRIEQTAHHVAAAAAGRVGGRGQGEGKLFAPSG